MGMYDHVRIDVDKLPVTDEEKEHLRHTDFQTKDFDNVLRTVAITDDALLYDDKPYHGYLYFYGSTGRGGGNKFYEFNAKFTDGKLVDIERVKR